MTEAKCSICGKFTCELRSLGNDKLSCGVCRAIDRIRGVCNRLPVEASVNILSLLYSTEGQLRDLRHFGGALPLGSAVVLEPPEGESISSILRGPDESKASHVPTGQGVQRSSGVTSSSHRDTAEPASSNKVRKKKKNRGQKRKEWQDIKSKISIGRNADTVGDDLDWSDDQEEIS